MNKGFKFHLKVYSLSNQLGMFYIMGSIEINGKNYLRVVLQHGPNHQPWHLINVVKGGLGQRGKKTHLLFQPHNRLQVSQGYHPGFEMEYHSASRAKISIRTCSISLYVSPTRNSTECFYGEIACLQTCLTGRLTTRKKLGMCK